jgi:CelD/BcsL family acetyltransferase involved in cellulose biosynthesis
MDSAVQVRVLQTGSDLELLGEEWDELLADSSSDCLFLTREWMTSWWRHLKGARALHVIEVRDEDRLLGLAPFTVSRGRIEFMGTGTVGSDYLDVIARRGSELEVIDAVARNLQETGVNLHFSHCLMGSVVQRLADRLGAGDYRVFGRRISVCPYMVLSGHTWDSFLSTLGRRHRENIRRRIRKLPGDATFRLTETLEDLRRNLPSLIELHHQRWDGRGGSDGLQKGPIEEFHRDFTERALARGWLRLFVLDIGDRPVAAVYAFNRKGRALYYQAGVAPEHSGMSLGLVALGLSIQHLLDEGAIEYDLLHGDEEYKSLWTRDTRELHALDAYPRSLKGSLTMHSQRVLRAAKTMARYVITR